MSYRISTAKLWSASWNALCRLGKSLGIRIRPGPEDDRRGKLVKFIQIKIDEMDMAWWASKNKKGK